MNNKINVEIMKNYLIFMAVVGTTLILSSCAKVPQVELDAANSSIEKAKLAEANIYLESEFLALQDSMNHINGQIEESKGKIFGGFNEVKAKLTMVNEQANVLAEKTATRKEEIKSELGTTQVAIEAIMAENNQLVEMAPRGKEGNAAIAAIKGDLESISVSINEIPALVNGGKLLDAQAKTNAAQQKAQDINTELKTVLGKYLAKN